MLDRTLAALSILALFAFTMVVTTFVNEPDLWIIILVVVFMAAYDFWRELRAGGTHLEDKPHEREHPS